CQGWQRSQLKSMDTYNESDLLEWCKAVLGPVEMLADHSREHPGDRTSTYRLRTDSGICYLKVHNDPAHWHNEVHGYRAWAGAFGPNAPRLLAVRDKAPLALVVTALPGQILDEVRLPAIQEQKVWQEAGKALAVLHKSATGAFFGPCREDGRPAGAVVTDAQVYIGAELESWQRRGEAIGCLTPDEMAIVAGASSLLPAFAGEKPIPCHRDYGPANWLVTKEGVWSGVIDFEFAQWDVRMADFTRYPNWEWIDRPDLIEAFHTGYGRAFTPAEESQRLVCHVLYSLAAVVWGQENAYFGFAAKGRRALARLR
ncbi:MAG: aminoglycoside phosphotransferase family protein, partial [Caldilineaceae bacterium]